jgi:hypothetical protein
MNKYKRNQTVYWSATDSQKMERQCRYSVMIPESTLATRMPIVNPETTIDIAEARRSGGARSPTSGSMICGVTVATPVKNCIAIKAFSFFVVANPML